MLYYNYQRDRVTVLADVNSLPRTQKKSQKSFKKHLTPKKKSGIIKIRKGERKMQRTLYKKTKTTRGYWKDFLTSKQMKKFANREVRRKKV